MDNVENFYLQIFKSLFPYSVREKTKSIIYKMAKNSILHPFLAWEAYFCQKVNIVVPNVHVSLHGYEKQFVETVNTRSRHR